MKWTFGKGYGVRNDSAAVVERIKGNGWQARKLGCVLGHFATRREAINAVDAA